MKHHLLLVPALLTAALAGCATAPKPLQGEFTDLLPIDASGDERVGERVRWGGEIIAVDNQPDHSCFELLGKPLAGSARPARGDQSAGRFLACREGFYDPAKFEVGRDVTVIGTIDAIEPRPIGAFQYRYPRVAADVIYLWQERDPQRMRPVGFWVGQHGNAWLGYWTPIYLPY